MSQCLEICVWMWICVWLWVNPTTLLLHFQEFYFLNYYNFFVSRFLYLNNKSSFWINIHITHNKCFHVFFSNVFSKLWLMISLKGKIQLQVAVDLCLLAVAFSICSKHLFVELPIELSINMIFDCLQSCWWSFLFILQSVSSQPWLPRVLGKTVCHCH